MRETRERQVALWKDFILDYCRNNRVRRRRKRGCAPALTPLSVAQVCTVCVEEDTALVCNTAINRAWGCAITCECECQASHACARQA